MLSIPTSSAASELSWSIHPLIHSKRRNRLKPARVENLAFLYTNVGDKSTTSQVHYKTDDPEAVNSYEDSDRRTDFSDMETPSETCHRRISTSRRYSL
ncbi:hypothetical protein JG688_00017793 [Phytophthora aleatoria]|uniref:HAT C-terminal dimerisation domain-containing protein n=1 Tax=Phytophthora aleatoria TaxID=2496075 RepID=A0A8J5LV37_9STRA|nr:hypothetical protein JG688_00017793 [Phytophthora aleatoria]